MTKDDIEDQGMTPTYALPHQARQPAPLTVLLSDLRSPRSRGVYRRVTPVRHVVEHGK